MSSFKIELLNGVLWMSIAKYSGIVIQLVIMAILARLISPAAFGTIAVAIVILYFLNIIADIGIGPAVVQYKQLDKANLNSLFTLNIYIGILLTSILFLLSDPISQYYGDTDLKPVCRMMSIAIFFNALNVVPNALMRRDKRFKTIAFRTVTFQFLSGCMAVWGAFNGWGIYALLVSPIFTAIGVFVVNFYNYPQHFVLVMDKKIIKMISSYSIFQFAFSFCNYFSRNLDKLIIGKYFSLTQLGYYDKSYHLMLLPMQNITYVIEPVLHPILSSLQDDKHDIGQKNLKLAVLLSRISFPLALILFFCSKEIIRIAFGDQWDASIPVFKILALSLPLQMVLSTSGPIYQAAGKTNYLFINGIINTSCTVAGFIVAATFVKTIEAMAWAWVVTLTINFINSYLIIYRIALKEKVWPFFRSFIPQMINTFLVFFIMLTIANNIQEGYMMVSLILKAILICFLTILIAIIIRQYNIKTIISQFYNFTQRNQ